MDESRESGFLGAQLDAAWERRVAAANDWNIRLAAGEIAPSALRRARWAMQALRGSGSYRERRAALETAWREDGGRKQASLAWALNDVFGRDFWFGGAFKVVGDTAQLMGPILVKSIINYGKAHAAAVAAGQPPPSIGPGVGMAIGLLCTTVTTSVCQHQVRAATAYLSSWASRTAAGHDALMSHTRAVFLALHDYWSPRARGADELNIQARREPDRQGAHKSHERGPRDPYLYRCEPI